MALANYSELKTDLIAWVADDNIDDTRAALCIKLAEADINRELKLRVTHANDPLSLSAAASTITLPAAFIELIAAHWSDYERGPIQRSIEDLRALKTTLLSSARPQFFALTTSIEFERAADISYTLNFSYWKGFDIATDSTNWLLTNHPIVYFNGALHYAYQFIENDAQEVKYGTLFNKAMYDVQDAVARNQRALARVDDALTPRAGVHNILTDT